MVRLKTAYEEFDFEAVCPTLDHDLLSQAHMYFSVRTGILVSSTVLGQTGILSSVPTRTQLCPSTK